MTIRSTLLAAAAGFAVTTGAANAVPLSVDFQELPMEGFFPGPEGVVTISGGFIFDNELRTVSDVSITSLNRTYDMGVVEDQNGRFSIRFTDTSSNLNPTLFPTSLDWTFLEPAIGFDAKIDEIVSGTSNDPFLRADLRETNGFLTFARGNGLAVQPMVIATTPDPTPPAVPLPAGLPLLAAALAWLGLFKDRRLRLT